MIAVASVDDPDAIKYAMELISFLNYYNFPVDKIYGDPPDNKVLMPHMIRELSRGLVYLFPLFPFTTQMLLRNQQNRSARQCTEPDLE
jgi:hypothetical protein